jgi:hypothetical protein
VAAPKFGWINPGVLEAPIAKPLGNSGAEIYLDKLRFTVNPRWTKVGVDEQLIRGRFKVCPPFDKVWAGRWAIFCWHSGWWRLTALGVIILEASHPGSFVLLTKKVQLQFANGYH